MTGDAVHVGQVLHSATAGLFPTGSLLLAHKFFAFDQGQTVGHMFVVCLATFMLCRVTFGSA
jgi:hypothetical protein